MPESGIVGRNWIEVGAAPPSLAMRSDTSTMPSVLPGSLSTSDGESEQAGQNTSRIMAAGQH
jgi:hypothetical protein